MGASAKEKRQFILLLLVVWLAFCAAHTWFFFMPWLELRTWRTAQAQVQRVTLAEPPFGHGECQNQRRDPANELVMVVVVYTFQVSGQQFTSNQFTHDLPGEVECTRPDALETKAKYEAAKRITVHYDPADPKRSVVRLPDELAVFLGSFALGASLLGLIIAFIRAGRSQGGGAST